MYAFSYFYFILKAYDDLVYESSHAYRQRFREEESLQVGSFQDVLWKKRTDLVCLANDCKEGLSNNITFIIHAVRKAAVLMMLVACRPLCLEILPHAQAKKSYLNSSMKMPLL